MAAPFFVAAARGRLREVDRPLPARRRRRCAPRASARFFRVLVPLALPSLLAGAAMSWARALGEFGATITFAGNFPGVTQTMPLAVYIALQSDLEPAVALSIVLVAMSFGAAGRGPLAARGLPGVAGAGRSRS